MDILKTLNKVADRPASIEGMFQSSDLKELSYDLSILRDNYPDLTIVCDKAYTNGVPFQIKGREFRVRRAVLSLFAYQVLAKNWEVDEAGWRII